MCWSVFLKKLDCSFWPTTLLKRDASIGVAIIAIIIVVSLFEFG